MARPLRIEFPGGLYHVTARGNGRLAIFADDTDRERFLLVLTSVVSRYHVLCHAYCLMDNHYHMLLETPEANLSRAMRQLNGVYSQAFNRRHQRPGHVLEGRFHARVVDKDAYLHAVCRYIVLNPVRAELVTHPGQWCWSSYRATAGEAPVPAFLTVDWVLSLGDTYCSWKRDWRGRSHRSRLCPQPWWWAMPEACLTCGTNSGAPPRWGRFHGRNASRYACRWRHFLRE